MSYDTLRLSHEDGIDILTLYRPGALNAFNATMSAEIEDYFRRVNDRDEVRAVVVTGDGRAFCAGVDLSSGLGKFADPARAATTLAELDAHFDDESMRGVRDIGGRSTLAIYDCIKPVIAAINGPCVGIGATLTLPMDVRFASEDARIGFVFGRVGIVLEACSSWFLPRIVGMSRALEWCYRARVMSAQEALDGGLLRELVPGDRLLAHAVAFARSLIEVSSPVSIAMTRQLLLRNSAAAHPAEAHKAESLTLLHALTHDATEGVRAFHEKRAPRFTSSPSRDLPPFFADWVAGRRGPADAN
ncbi:enoyl-CoA hydratase-related protein [Nevskia sp.]|uniref:enoyl-CoA hydratase-related protein n=1 Tax=Nevskia sp. TaxID=1929292 RepID=UPI0025F7EF12|nr:enoyl-CoA hydratase-related protein [Nevskia sp.]